MNVYMMKLLFMTIAPSLLIAYLGYILRWQTWGRITYPYSSEAAQKSGTYSFLAKFTPIATVAACAAYMILQSNPELNPAQSYQIPMVIFGFEGKWDYVPGTVTVFGIIELLGTPLKPLTGFTMENVFFRPVSTLVLIIGVPLTFFVRRNIKKKKAEGDANFKTGLFPLLSMQITGIILFMMATVPTIIALGIGLALGGLLVAVIGGGIIMMGWFFGRVKGVGFRI